MLLEAESHPSHTIYRYQKGKHVMAEPAMIPLRSPVPFEAGTRESLLDAWNRALTTIGVDLHRPEAVTAIQRQADGFQVVTDKATYHARYVILAIGIQGNPRRMNVPGETLPHVTTRLVDPSIYENEDILVVGAGDAAIEGVLALCEKNRVSVVNRNAEFYRLKDALDREINKRVASGQVTAFHSAAVERVEEGHTYLKLPDRTVKVKADLVVVRIGAEIPRKFLDTIGIAFTSADPTAPPQLTERYETTIPGLFMIGAVAGYNLIKQGMNQGHDVVAHLAGRPVEPVDEPLLKEKLTSLQGSVDERLASLAAAVPLLGGVPKQTLRELVLESTLHAIPKGTVVFREHDYSDSFYNIIAGRVGITFEAKAAGSPPILLQQGEFFGEMSLLSGRRRSATVTADADCLLLETPRKGMLRLLNLEPSVRRAMDQVFIQRVFRDHLLPDASREFLQSLAAKAHLCHFKQGEVVFREGEAGDALYVIKNGSVKVSRHSAMANREVVVSYVPAGGYFGEMALLNPERPNRTATITATKTTEAIKLNKADFDLLLQDDPTFAKRLRDNAQKALLRGQEVIAREIADGHVLNDLMQEGVFEGTDVLLIDENRCVRCNQCVSACAGTHGGQTRLYRTEGIIFANLLVPTSCRHCENPLCLSDCLAGDAILRDPKGEVFIRDNCIGCGNCAKNCPYGNIHMMHGSTRKELGPLDRLLVMLGVQSTPPPTDHDGPAKAVKCDLCRDNAHGPACVRICPTGAAMRVAPEEYFRRVGLGAL